MPPIDATDPPALLLLEDDPVVARFVLATLAPLGWPVEHVVDLAGAAARADARQRLWLFDVHLPDGVATGLLPTLRARGLMVPALALTADTDTNAHARLLVAGFVAVLAKPFAADALRAAVRAWARGPAIADDPGRAAACWNDDAALAALGDADAVRVLRRLFLDELPAQHRHVLAESRAGDVAGVRARLHRLQAGCGFVGAAALLRSTRALSAAPTDAAALACFDRDAAALLGDG